MPNLLKCRIPVLSQLRPDRWCFHLADYWDSQLLDQKPFGFPLDFNREFALQSTFEIHTSALKYKKYVDAYIQGELQHNALYGPFDNPPFPVHGFRLVSCVTG